MKNRNGFATGFRAAPAVVLAVATGLIALTNGCSAAQTAIDASQGCDEFAGGSSSVAALSIDGTTKAFVEASADFVGVVSSMETSVYNACKQIDADLGVTDTWSAMPTLDKQTTEACTQAQVKITSILNAGAAAEVTCTVSVTGGGCQVQANAEADCEASCTGTTSCTPPDVTVTCEPGDLSVECSGMCNASAVCEGTVSVAANCQGSCSADCTGECDVSATAPTVHCEGSCAGNCSGQCDGSTANGTACSGTCSGRCSGNCTYTGGVKAHCDGSCKGTCNGDCKLDSMSSINCGASVRCRGGCNVAGTAPQCEGKVVPAMCSANTSCQAACKAHAEVQASCTPPSATLECDGAVMPPVLITTLQTNLPVILAAIQTQGPLAADAGAQVVTTGAAVVQSIGSVSGKALACAGTAVTAAQSATASLHVTVMVSVSVSGSCGGPTS